MLFGISYKIVYWHSDLLTTTMTLSLFALLCCLLHYHSMTGALAFTPQHRGASRIFLDTAGTNDWDELLPTGIFHGVTTNPTLLQRANVPCNIQSLHSLAQRALQMTDEFMCQAWGESAQEMYQCGMALSQPSRDSIVVKVPVTLEGVQAAKLLVQGGVRVCLTACYNHKQALLAASVGAEYIAPYLGRMNDAGKDGVSECLKMQAITQGMQSDTRILVASIRDAQTMVDLAAKGMETFTFSPEVARELFVEPLTTQAARDFEQAAIANAFALELNGDHTEASTNGSTAAPQRQPTAEDFGTLPDECELEFEEDGSISIMCEEEFVAGAATVSD